MAEQTGLGPYAGYDRPLDAPEDAELTHTGRGTPCGALFRRFWQPVALAGRVADRPLAVRVLGEDLVLFRDRSGRFGLLHKHCSHRGASLEFGQTAERGLRCCYHGWLYDVDGRLLEAPGEPAETPLTRTIFHGAYPVREFAGLVFAYLGPPADRPPFPAFDTLSLPDNELVPYCLEYPCNWLQVHENQMDPLHAVFLHSRAGSNHFTEAWGEMPVVEYGSRRDRMWYVATRRVGGHAWVRLNEVIVPNIGQVAALWETGAAPRYFQRVGITRWTVPVDDRSCRIFGFRHFNDQVEPPGEGLGNRAIVGYDSFDIYGQTGGRSYEQMQADPSDWEAQVSQRPIAAHALENLGVTDTGVAILRRQLRKAIGGEVEFRGAHGLLAGDENIPTWTCNVVIPCRGDIDDAGLRIIGRKIRDVIAEGDDLLPGERHARIAAALQAL